jgi:regulator of cell morphogenesis and NO signaling
MTYPKVGEIVAGDIRAAEVLKKLNIDFCCGGGISLERACKKKGLDPAVVMAEIDAHLAGKEPIEDKFGKMCLTELADYVTEKHHSYVRESAEFIDPLLDKVIRVHGDAHPELNEIGDLFYASVNELQSHMKKEENILFPLIKALEAGTIKELDPKASVKYPIEMMEEEHTQEGDRFTRIRELTNDYTPPSDACNTYKLTYYKLKEFNDDLEQHIHLENNILFPKSIKMEEELG